MSVELKAPANLTRVPGTFGFKSWPPVSVAGWVLREIFVALLLVLTFRVSIPETETLWRALESTADLLRVILGLVVCAWLANQLFRIPKDAQACHTWFFLGLAAVPFALICVVYFW